MSNPSRSPMREPVVGGPTIEAPFVGRSAELEVLLGSLDDAYRDGTPRYVLVDGAAGIGKSRLVREFLAEARTRAPSAAILQGRCLATGRGVSYWALAEVLRRACGIGLDDRAEDAEQRLRDGLQRILAPLGLTTAETEETLNALATSAGIVIAGQSPRARRPTASFPPPSRGPGVGSSAPTRSGAERSSSSRISTGPGPRWSRRCRRSRRCSRARSSSSPQRGPRSWGGSRVSWRRSRSSASRSRRSPGRTQLAWSTRSSRPARFPGSCDRPSSPARRGTRTSWRRPFAISPRPATPRSLIRSRQCWWPGSRRSRWPSGACCRRRRSSDGSSGRARSGRRWAPPTSVPNYDGSPSGASSSRVRRRASRARSN